VPLALAFAIGALDRLDSAAKTAAPAQGGSHKSRWQLEQGRAPSAEDNNQDCAQVMIPGDLVKCVVEVCAPECQARELEELVRLIGGGTVNDTVSL